MFGNGFYSKEGTRADFNGLLFPKRRKEEPWVVEFEAIIDRKEAPVKTERSSMEVNSLLFPRRRKEEPLFVDIEEFVNENEDLVKAERTIAEINALLFPRQKEALRTAEKFVERRRCAR